MADNFTLLTRAAEYIGAHRLAQRAAQERDRALQRGVAGCGFAAVWMGQALAGQAVHADTWFVITCVAYGVAGFAYRSYLHRHPDGGVPLMYAMLVMDPVVIVGVLVEDPQTFAFLNPFLMVVIVRSGLRYGVRTMYLAWGVAVVASGLLATSEYWRSNTELSLAFLLMLGLAPVFFAGLIRSIHNARTIEEERARFVAMREVVMARSAFLAKVSHELRSPLQGIVSALDVFEMRHRMALAGDEELIGRMRRSSLLLNAQLRDLLTLAKGEAGRLEVRPESFEACALVEAMVESARELAAARGLELTIELPPDAVFVVADGTRVDQILTNLVINSIRYTDAGQVRVAMHPFRPGSRLLRFTVADTGPGIPEAMLPTLFAPDHIATGVERRGEGSGIGLAIVRTLVQLLGGTISVASQVGRGTTFTLDIPVEPVEPVDEFADEFSTGRVLVVDDREDVLDALASVVDELGFECDRASSAAIGANLLAARRYDVVLLDVEMPQKGGAELAAEVKRGNGANRDARFIGMSAAEVSDSTRGQFDACLGKPINRSMLRRALLGPGHGARPSQPALWSEAD